MIRQRCEFSTSRSTSHKSIHFSMKFLHSAFVAPAFLQRGDVKLSQSALLSSVSNFNVGGNKFTIYDEDVRKHPTSLLLRLAESAPVKAGIKEEIEIDRSGALFKYVNAFLVNGQLPRNDDGYITLDEPTLTELQAEADFYGLRALSDDCKVHQKKSLDLESYMTIRRYLQGELRQRGRIKVQKVEGDEDEYEDEYEEEDEDEDEVDDEDEAVSQLRNVLQSFDLPYCVKGTVLKHDLCRSPLFKSTTASSVNVEELVAFATQSPFGRGTETIIDTSVRNSFEINASQLDAGALADISKQCDLKNLAPHLDLTIRPYKLVIYKEGGHFDEHRDTVRGDGHIGTLVVILNSTYTGGELEVTHDRNTEVVTGPYNWVAMYGDCLHKINPVTSGTRVSLIYDIYGAPPTKKEGAGQQGSDFRPASKRNRAKEAEFWRCVKKEFERYDSIILGLRHRYPYGQANPAYLKGRDRALYDLLQKKKKEFDVEVVAATIYTYNDYAGDNDMACSLFTPTIVKRAMGILPDEPPAPKEKTKLIMLDELSNKVLLDYSPYAERLGNEGQAEENCYLVAGLQVRKKKNKKQ